MNLRKDLDAAGGLISARGIAKELGITGEYVRQLAQRKDFPSPIQVSGGWRVWVRSEVKAWAAVHRP